MHILDEKHQINVDKVLNTLKMFSYKATTWKVKNLTCSAYSKLYLKILHKQLVIPHL